MHLRQSKSYRSNFLKNQLVASGVMTEQVIQFYHDSPMSAHSGIHDTFDRIRERYLFKQMGSLITDFVKSFDSCWKRKVPKHTTNAGITGYPIPTECFKFGKLI